MAASSVKTESIARTPGSSISRHLPFLHWMLNYQREDLAGDLIAGVVVAIMLVPQGMAYALLAGLPPQVGLYASIVPLMIYGILGTSRALAVGPVAIVSLMVGTGIAALNPPDLATYLAYAVTLALLIGVIQLLMGVFRVGFLVNFLSHSVLAGFITAAAIVIAFSQVKYLLGISIPRAGHVHETILLLLKNITQTNPITLAIGIVSILVLLFFQRMLPGMLKRAGWSASIITPITRGGPLFVIILTTLAVFAFNLNETAGVAIVGDVPAGLPPVTMPIINLAAWQQLLPLALTIGMLGYMESISVAKSLASQTRDKVDANQELIALGAANLGAAFTGAYPVAGGIARSVVNHTAGARTGLASLITASLIALTVLMLTPLFYYLPSAVLAAIIVVAIAKLIDFSALVHAWHYSRADAFAIIVTFAAVLLWTVEDGIILGVAVSLMLFLWRTSRPHIAVLGQIGATEHYRNVLRHETTTHPGILVVRVDESLYFPNAQYLESFLMDCIADRPEVQHLVLVCSAVNYIDTSALQSLEALVKDINRAGVEFYMAEVKGPIMDRLEKIGFIDEIGRNHIFISTHVAVQTLVAPLETV